MIVKGYLLFLNLLNTWEWIKTIKSGKKLLKTEINGHGRSWTVIDGEKRWGNGERRWVTVAKNGNGTVTVTGQNQ